MENLLTLSLVAHNAERNHHRRYAVTVGRDLLNDWTVAIRFGRTGQQGQEIRYANADPSKIAAIIRDRLRRRLSAPKRIGCPYRLDDFSAAPGFDAGAWLPGEVIAEFCPNPQVSDEWGILSGGSSDDAGFGAFVR